ncbi:carbohydrate ABC transporter permease [Jiangella sp. DSM 45060]|uniref:carbohydrate ABC transporter permease n=1 Tax=Jiangella sp. DSM 45060 TaxID=1798224 RepID=UPI00087D3D62|nr:sugar ABC transporter permease [Jiangella sp. DSM 45060]SDT57342.1 raffinose/stachyose/melibiose transport system permease protein [Jiangella sp. DSM 45060]
MSTALTDERRDVARRRPSAPRTRRRGRHRAYLYVLPAAAVYAAFSLWPGLNTVYYSLHRWDGLNPAEWTGFDNYAEVFTDPDLFGSILHSLVLVLFFAAAPIIVGLLLTGLLMGRGTRGMTAFRVIYFLPQVVPLVAVGVTWRWIYAEDGVVNQALRAAGLDALASPWLARHTTALIAIGLIGTWCMTGLCMMLFVSGAQKIDASLYEAAAMDGAGAFRRFTSVTLPGLRGEISVAAVITTIAALASFDLIYVTTGGGPENATTVPGLLVYRLAFSYGEVGGAAALAVVLTVLILAFVTAIRRLTREKE